MKPFDGGQWVGVTRISDAGELHAQYDDSGERLMHLQAGVDGFDVFARSLSIGAETQVMHFDPDAPMHERYRVEHDFLSAETGWEVVTISRLVNAFFRWEFNSCENLVRGAEVHPIDYANASPDVALTSLHYYFPWAIETLVKWCVFCVVTGRRMAIDQDKRRYFEIGDRDDLGYEEKLREYRAPRGRVLRGRGVRRVLRAGAPVAARAGRRLPRGPRLRPPARRVGRGRCSRRTSRRRWSPATAASSASGRRSRPSNSAPSLPPLTVPLHRAAAMLGEHVGLVQ